ncbi:MAG: hypothetical protein OEV80_14225, partial [candidate division Zixibacteria bacterium]|nr:hypothetical protein [candidate division Zixibacteria bacterium]
MTSTGLPPGWDDIAATIATQVDPSEIGKTLCIDSAFFPPSGAWLWSGVGSPAWNGPYCWDIIPPPDTCPYYETAQAASYFWGLPNSWEIPEWGERITPLAGACCTLKTAKVLVYGDVTVGSPDMTVTVYADDGAGLPGAALASVTVPSASLPATFGYAVVDFSAFNLIFCGQDFHIGVQNTGDPALDTLAIISDDGTAGSNRSWAHYQGFYYTILTLFGTGFEFNIGVELCCGAQEPPRGNARMEDEIWQIPPHGRVYQDPRKRPVVDPNTGDTLYWVWHKHRVRDPETGQGTIPTGGWMGIVVGPTPPIPGQEPDETIHLGGTSTLSWESFGEGELFTQLLEMDLTGRSQLFGEAILTLSPQASYGWVYPNSPDEFFPAESFFDVYYQVNFPEIGVAIEPGPATPPHMEAQNGIEAIPPFNTEYADPNWHPVVNVLDSAVIIGWVRPVHWVQPPDSLGACCDTVTGACWITIEERCIGPDDEWQGDGTSCVPNPCPVIPKKDCFDSEGGGTITLDPDDTTCFYGVPLNLTSLLTPTSEVWVEPRPYQNGDTIQTEIVAFELSAVDPVWGTVIVRERADKASTGYIASVVTDGYGGFVSGESFFDVYLEVEVPDYGLLLNTGDSALHLQASITSLPPTNAYFPVPTQPPLKLVEAVSTVHRGWLCHAQHQPTVPHPCDSMRYACCDMVTGACRLTSLADCDGPNEEPNPELTSCVPNPCPQCVTWTPGIDTILFSAFEVELYDPIDSAAPPDTLTAFGAQMIVQRFAPFETAPGIWRMNTKVLQFSGAGTSANPAIGGPFSIDLDPGQYSGGLIEMCDSCDNYWARSEFSIHYRLNTSLPPPQHRYHGLAEMKLPCEAQWNPFPPGGEFTPPYGHRYVDPRKVPVYDADGNLVGYTWKRHKIAREPLGACCDTVEHTCRITSSIQCVGPADEYQGDNVPCHPNPCVCTQWTPGIDTILFSSFEVLYYDGSDTLNPVSALYAFGVQMVVQRGTPYEVAPGIWRMDTDILQFGGNGTSALTGGPFTVGLDPTLQSGGYIQMCDSCNDNWAESFFDLNYEILTSLPWPSNRWRGNAQMILPCEDQWDPFEGGEFNPPNGNSYNDPRKVPIIDENGEVIGYVWKQHNVDDEPLGACCDYATGACRMTSAVRCFGPNEAYMGDGVPCSPNPCICTDWIPGMDTILFSAFEVELFDLVDPSVSLGTVTAFGANMVVMRYNLHEEVPGSGIWKLDTKVLSLTGAGTSALVGGAFTIDLDPNSPDTGFIRMCDSCNDNWAESFFDFDYRVTGPSAMYTGNAQMGLDCDDQWNPFPGGEFAPPYGHRYIDPRKVPIIDEATGDTLGYTMKRHSIDVDSLGACCDTIEHTCHMTTEARCIGPNDEYQGDGIPCDPNPCEPCSTGWNGGIDTIPVHDFEIELYDPSGIVLLTTLYATGQDMIVQRSAPFEVAPGTYRMNTTILEFGGSGDDPVLLGPFEIQLDPTQPSGGYIQMCNWCDDHQAESFFDVYFVITTGLPFPMDVLHGAPAQMHLSCAEGWDPMDGDAFTPPFDRPYNDPRIVPILDNNGQVIGHTRKRHIPRPCCSPPDRPRGDINCDGTPGMDISDLVFLVDYMFTGGPPPCCF